jgi:hypothetical protein
MNVAPDKLRDKWESRLVAAGLPKMKYDPSPCKVDRDEQPDEEQADGQPDNEAPNAADVALGMKYVPDGFQETDQRPVQRRPRRQPEWSHDPLTLVRHVIGNDLLREFQVASLYWQDGFEEPKIAVTMGCSCRKRCFESECRNTKRFIRRVLNKLRKKKPQKDLKRLLSDPLLKVQREQEHAVRDAMSMEQFATYGARQTSTSVPGTD